VALHANAIAENRTASERARRIDGDDADCLLFVPIARRKAVNQSALARAGRTCHADANRAARVWENLAEDFLGIRAVIFYGGDRARKGSDVARTNLFCPIFNGDGHL
jgi:hypothetical protein